MLRTMEAGDNLVANVWARSAYRLKSNKGMLDQPPAGS